MLQLDSGNSLWSQAAVVMAAVGMLFFLAVLLLGIALLLGRSKKPSSAQRRALETVEHLYRTAFYLVFQLLLAQILQALARLYQGP